MKDTEVIKGHPTPLDTSKDCSGDTESVESSSSGDSSPPSTKKVQMYADYFHPDMTQGSCDVVVLTFLQKNSIPDIQLVKYLTPSKKLFKLTLIRGQDKNTFIRAIANSLYIHKYISFKEGSDLVNLKREDINILNHVSL